MAGPAPKYYTNANQVPGVAQGYARNNQTGQTADRYFIPGGQLGFAPGHGYYVKQPGRGGGRSSIAQAAAADPYSQLTGYQPLTAAQIQKQAQGEIDPIIQAITGTINGQVGRQASQINALTQDYANELGQINFASPYQSAEGQQAAVDAALQQSLTGAGSDLAGGLSDRLKALQGTSGQAAVDQAAQALSSQGASSGTTALANGSAALSNLIANAAAGADFGQKLPGIAKLSGIQALGQNAGQAQQNLANATEQIESQLPSIIQDLTANNQDALSNAVSARQKQQALDFENAVKDATLGLDTQKTNAQINQGNARVRVAQQNANTAAYRAAQAQAQAAAKAARPDATLSKAKGYWVDANGDPIGGKITPIAGYRVNPKTGQVQKDPNATPPKPLSVAESRIVASKANTIAEVAYKGGTDSKGNPLPQLTYQQALAEMRDEGLLANPQSAKLAVAALNRLYGQGERGRPVSKKSKAAFKAASAQMTSPLDALTGGH